jgi:hypothetical protein
MRKEHMLQIRARFAHTPAQADYVVKAVRAMFYWGEERGFVHSINPGRAHGAPLEQRRHRAVDL